MKQLARKLYWTISTQWEKLLQAKSEDPETQLNKYFGTGLVLLSGLAMYIDKFTGYFNIQVGYEFTYYPDLDVFLWTIEQTLAVLFLVIAAFFKPYKWSYALPFAVFSMQLAYVWRDEGWILHEYFYFYTIGFMAIIAVLIVLLKYAIKQISEIKTTSTDANVETLVNFVVEVHNHHFAEILKSADALELLGETSISEEDRKMLIQMYRMDKNKAIRNFEVRIIETMYRLDKPKKKKGKKLE